MVINTQTEEFSYANFHIFQLHTHVWFFRFCKSYHTIYHIISYHSAQFYDVQKIAHFVTTNARSIVHFLTANQRALLCLHAWIEPDRLPLDTWPVRSRSIQVYRRPPGQPWPVRLRCLGRWIRWSSSTFPPHTTAQHHHASIALLVENAASFFAV